MPVRPTSPPSPAEKQAKSDAARLRSEGRDVNLDEMLQDHLRLLADCLDALKRELYDAPGGIVRSLTPQLSARVKDLTAAFNSATDAQVRLDKTAAERAKRMTPADWLAAIREYVMAMPWADRAELLQDLTGRHNTLGPE